jgi:hypothetical protein
MAYIYRERKDLFKADLCFNGKDLIKAVFLDIALHSTKKQRCLEVTDFGLFNS